MSRAREELGYDIRTPYTDARNEERREKKLTVRQRIERFLRQNRTRWVGLTEIQERIHASSTRSRLQELMQDERMRPEGEREFYEREIPGLTTRAKEYRFIPPTPDAQGQLFHVEPDRRMF